MISLSPEVNLVQDVDTAGVVHLVTTVVHVTVVGVGQPPTLRVDGVVEFVAVDGSWKLQSKFAKAKSRKYPAIHTKHIVSHGTTLQYINNNY